MGLFNKFFGKKNKDLKAQKKSRQIKAKSTTETAEDHLRNAYTFWNDKKNLTDAIQECKTAIEINPNFAVAHCMLADIYKDQNNRDDAIKAYKDALHIDPDYALARSNLGMVYHLQGNDEVAIKEWEETLRRGASTIIRMNTEDFIKDAQEHLAKRSKRRKEKEKQSIVEALLDLKKEFEALTEQYPRNPYAHVPRAEKQIPWICRTLGEAANSLVCRRDPFGNPITEEQIKDGLLKLISMVKNPEYITTMDMAHSGLGRSLENLMDKLQRLVTMANVARS